jgi:hypothetical protein
VTPEEHELIVRMFAKYSSYIEFLLRILQSREVIEDGDIGAFLAMVRSDQDRISRGLLSVKGDYLRFAEEIGLDVKFPDL